MKQRILTLACALFAFVAMASAQEYYMNVKTTDGKVKTYASSEFEKVTFGEWTSLGNCQYTDDFFTTFYAVDPETWEVEIQESVNQPGLFRLVYPYDGKYYWNDPGDWDESKTYYLEINACDPEGVYITQQEIGVDWGHGMISVWSLADYYMDGGYSFDEVKSFGYCGTYEDGIITFPYMALLISMSNYNSGAWYYANYNSAFKVVMPGVTIPDYSISLSTDGEVDEETKTVTATVTLGEDVETARVALVESSNSSSAIEAVEAGEVEYTEITESGEVTLSCTKSGTYYLVAVSYAKDKARESAYERISYQGTWTSLGNCQYTDDFFTTFWYVENLTWEVEIQECDEQPGLYRLVYPYDGKYPYNEEYDDGTADWDKSKTYYLEINACDPEGVYITPQEIGVDWGNGMISLSSYSGYYISEGWTLDQMKEEGHCGTLKDGVITFSEKDLLISMAGYYGGGWYYANYNGAFKVVLPGASGVNAQQKVAAAVESMDKSNMRNVKPIDVKGTVKKNAKYLID